MEGKEEESILGRRWGPVTVVSEAVVYLPSSSLCSAGTQCGGRRVHRQEQRVGALAMGLPGPRLVTGPGLHLWDGPPSPLSMIP